MTEKAILQELKFIEKCNTDETNLTVDYDGFARDVFNFMEKLKKDIKRKS